MGCGQTYIFVASNPLCTTGRLEQGAIAKTDSICTMTFMAEDEIFFIPKNNKNYKPTFVYKLQQILLLHTFVQCHQEVKMEYL